MASRSVGQAYKRFDGAQSYDAIIVGSGIGGLACALLLAKYGQKKILVLERHYTAGGFTHTFKRPGYEWDVGVHYIGDVGDKRSATRRMFDELAGGRLEWAPMPDAYDRIILGDSAFDLVAGRDALRERLESYFPGESSAIGRHFALVREVTRSASGFFAEKAVPAPMAWLAGGLLRRRFMRLASRTTRDVLEELTGDQQLIAVLTGQFGDYGLPPSESSFAIHAMVHHHYLKGGFYPIGGAGEIAVHIGHEIEQRGGSILINAEVKRILVEGTRATGVEMIDGRVLRAPIVVSDAGVANTCDRLLGEVGRPLDTLRRHVRSIGPAAAHLCLYLGCRASDDELGTQATNLWIYPDEKHDENIARFLRDPDAPLPLVYVSFPSRKDPSFQERYPGRATIEVLTLGSYDWFKAWEDRPWHRRSEAYEALKQRFSDRLLDALYQHVPQLKGRIDHCELSTPLSTRTFTNYEKGEIYGLKHTPQRFRTRSLKPRTPIRGLYLTGQDVCTCGVTGALFGGTLTASAVLGRNLMSRIASSSRR
ncbi:MAG: NAD(P)/FAD-dependent oxidoreductase [Acidobacteriota bacterium]|nr:NAD(P)/FAD-dependent oxidoreductase [Acidobacteriota bacterium]